MGEQAAYDDELVEPQEGECLVCFAARAVAEVGCRGNLAWVAHFRDRRVPAAVGVIGRLERIGVGCDCALNGTGYRLRRELMERDVHTDALVVPTPLPSCCGVRSTSARPCAHWVRPASWDR